MRDLQFIIQMLSHSTTFPRLKKNVLNCLAAVLYMLTICDAASQELNAAKDTNQKYQTSESFRNISVHIQPTITKLDQGLFHIQWENPANADGFLLHKDYKFFLEVKEPQAIISDYDHRSSYTIASYRNGIISRASLAAIYSGTAEPALDQASNSQELPIFEGAEGFGTTTVAGKYGALCKVVNKEDRGPGSLRDCIERKSPRRIEFKVSGTITLQSTLKITDPFVSILGQSAPSDGILVTLDKSVDGPVIHVATHDVLIQHLRIRAGAAHYYMQTCCRDSLRIGSDTPNSVYNVVVDHNSLSWASDEIVDVWNDSYNITISNNIIAEAFRNAEHYKGPTSRGMLVGENTHSISIHHNLFAHNYSRNPALFNAGINDIVNNVIYHWVTRGIEVNSHTETNKTNIVRNLFIPLTSHDTPHPTNLNWHEMLLKTDTDSGIKTYFEDNWSTRRENEPSKKWSIVATDWSQQYDPVKGLHTDERHKAPPITETPIAFLEAHVLANVGATQPKRDATDMRIITDLESRTGNIKDCVQGCQFSGSGWLFPK